MASLLRILSYFTSRLGTGEMISDAIFLIGLLVVVWKPHAGDRFFRACEKAGAHLAERKSAAVVLLALAAILSRLALLAYLPVPIPLVHDEFGHLLAGDTFAHGRLANPTHPMWLYFDTIHVNQHPAYMSKYPPGQGAVLAIGELLGHPWIGVLLSVAGMCAAILWMLQGWLPSRWALLGGILVLARIGISSYWINSYWGGAVPAIGGALVVGALPRIRRFARARDALLLAAGASILANSRPYEGIILCAPVAAILLWWLCSARSPAWRITLPRLVLPLCAFMILCGLFMGYYNRRLTGNALLLPEALNGQQYLRAPNFIWERPGKLLHYANPQFESYYNRWLFEYWAKNRVNSFRGVLKHTGTIALKFTYFFLWPELFVPLIALPWVLADRSMRILIVLLGASFLGWFSLVWFLPHYAAAVTAPIFALVVQMIRHLRKWEFRGRPLGIGISRVVVLFTVLLAPFHPRGGTLQPASAVLPPIAYRAQFASQLAAMPGQHLALVQYAPVSASSEWVYNSADIDHAKVVWARVIPGVSLQPLLDYFRGRQVWLVEPDASPPRMSPYAGTAAQ